MVICYRESPLIPPPPWFTFYFLQHNTDIFTVVDAFNCFCLFSLGKCWVNGLFNCIFVVSSYAYAIWFYAVLIICFISLGFNFFLNSPPGVVPCFKGNGKSSGGFTSFPLPLFKFYRTSTNESFVCCPFNSSNCALNTLQYPGPVLFNLRTINSFYLCCRDRAHNIWFWG